MTSLFRTTLWTIAVIMVIFVLSWGIKQYRMQGNEPESDIKQQGSPMPANPGGDWPQFHGNQAQTGSVSGRLPDKLALAWRFAAGAEVKSSPAVFNGRVYVASSDKHVYSLDLQTGEQVWSRLLDDEIEAPPTVIDHRVFIGTLAGTLYALDAESGEQQWTFRTDGKLVGGVNWFKNSENRFYILAGSYDSMLYCINAQSGKPLWTYQSGNYINGSPAVDNVDVVFGGCDAIVHILSLFDGTLKGMVDSGAYIAGSAAIMEKHAYVANYGGELLKASMVSQKVVWRYSPGKKPFVSSPAVTDGFVVIGSGDMRIHCIDSRTGDARWTYTTLDAVNSSPVIAGDKVVAGSDDGRLYLLSLADGRLLWSYETGRSITSSPAVAAGMIITGCDDGRVYCFK